MPYANTEAMNLHLQEISRGVAPGAHAALIFDGAGWHTTDKLELAREHHSRLPAALLRPELNPTENIWEYLRKKLSRAPRLRRLRRHRRRLLHGLERSPHHARSTRLHHPTKMGQGVMNYVGWYNRNHRHSEKIYRQDQCRVGHRQCAGQAVVGGQGADTDDKNPGRVDQNGIFPDEGCANQRDGKLDQNI